MDKKKVPMVVRYSFDQEVPVWLFDTEAEALAELKRQLEVELQEAKNNWGDSITIESHIASDGCYAELKEYFPERVDTTEWAIGCIKN